MKLLEYIKSMYGWVTVILILLAVMASFVLGSFPVNLIIAVLTAAILDLLIASVILKKPLALPHSAIITGLIIGSVLPFNSSLLVVFVAVFIALISKFLIRIKNTHIFNPAALGILISLAIFSLTDQWWSSMQYNVVGAMITLTPILILASYRARKLMASIPLLFFLGVLFYFGRIYTITAFAPLPLIGFLTSLPYFYAFVLISEPRTTPYKSSQQIAFGTIMAFLTFILLAYYIKYALFISLLIGNLGYFLYNTYFIEYVNRYTSLGIGILLVIALLSLYFLSPLASLQQTKSPNNATSSTTPSQVSAKVPGNLINNGGLNQSINDLNSLKNFT